MKESIKIICPTYKRADRVKTIDVFKDRLILACHEFEVDTYRTRYPDNEIMVLPDEIRGNMSKVRNYIRDNCGSRYLVMIDDDINEIGYHEKLRENRMSLPEIMDFLVNGFIMAEDLGTPLWGVNLQSDPKFYREYSPFSFLSPVLAPFCCHIIDDTVRRRIRYDERLGLNEDYDFFLQVIRIYHKVLRFNKYYYKADHLTVQGGCGAHRTLGEELRQAEIMIKKWGPKVVTYDFNKSTNPRIRVPFKGI